MTRLKGMGMFMAATWLGPALIIPSWSWVWKYMFEGRPARQGRWLIPHCIQVSMLPGPNWLFCLQFCQQSSLRQILTFNLPFNPLGPVPRKSPFLSGILRENENHHIAFQIKRSFLCQIVSSHHTPTHNKKARECLNAIDQ